MNAPFFLMVVSINKTVATGVMQIPIFLESFREIVWAGILGNAIVGPLFIGENLTGELYLHLLENEIDPLITTHLENQIGGNILQENEIRFQQDGAPPHYFPQYENGWMTDFLINGLVEGDR
ncbi:hypothetical protein ABEB36_014934 [Hypothenemus hampei]|uniref:Uncharacterized protein n=1 Tax=Hypothenemus hampei TaxID=57062 RepID=A0ABD1E1C0_HYPHA